MDARTDAGTDGGSALLGIGPGAVWAVVRRPALWWTAVTQLLVLAAPGWWRRSPHLPYPSAAYMRFRMQTQYGDPAHAPDPADVVSYLHWCRSMRAVTR